VDVVVARDSRRTRVSVIVLAVFGSLGVGYALLGGFAMLAEGAYQPLLIVLGGLTGLTLISAAWVATHKPSDTAGANIGRTVLGVLTISGVLVSVGALLMLSAVILLLVVCLSTSGKC
jgi:hypothetical protein